LRQVAKTYNFHLKGVRLSYLFLQFLIFLRVLTGVAIPHFLFFLSASETFTSHRLSNGEEDQKGIQDDDLEVVMASRDGDMAAFEILVRKHQNRMMNIAFRMTGDYEDAAETVQEAFLAAYRSIKKFRGEAKFSTWLYGICVNHAKNRSCQKQRRSFHEVVSLDDDRHDLDGSPAFQPADPHPSILEELERKALQEKVQKSINKLDQEHKQVLILRDIEGFSYEEISEMLHLPQGTVKSRLFRARDTLKTSLKGFIGDYL
jgi:RNA polymerase sigma-70 factor (ECF subfamily)